MSRTFDTSELINRQGGEVKESNEGIALTNAQPNFRPGDPGSALELNEPNVLGFPGTKFDVAKSFFTRKGVPDSLARAYGAALIETSRVTGKDITELINVKATSPNTFTSEALAHINTFRSKTSQVGLRITETNTDLEFIDRTILP